MLHEDLKRLCKVLSADLNRVVDKIENSGNVISATDLDYVDKLTHSIKSVETTMAMLSAKPTEEHSDNHEMVDAMKSLMEGVTDEYTLKEFHSFISKIES